MVSPTTYTSNHTYIVASSTSQQPPTATTPISARHIYFHPHTSGLSDAIRRASMHNAKLEYYYRSATGGEGWTPSSVNCQTLRRKTLQSDRIVVTQGGMRSPSRAADDPNSSKSQSNEGYYLNKFTFDPNLSCPEWFKRGRRKFF